MHTRILPTLSSLSTLLLLAGLVGCSSSPSSGEAKAAVTALLGSCPYVTLDRFKRLNGIERGPGQHDVEVIFTVGAHPIPGAAELPTDYDRLIKDCGDVHPMIQAFRGGQLRITTPVSKDFTATLPMIKTENGWRAQL